MSVKQDRTGTRTSEDLRRRINIEKIDEAVEITDANLRILNELLPRVTAMSASLNNTRLNYVSTQVQSFTESQKQIARANIGAGNSSFSGSYNDLTNRPTSLGNINSDELTKLNGIESGAEVNVIESVKVNGVAQTITNKEVNILPTTSYNLSDYAETGLTITRTSCIEKNKRVCINFVGTMSISANTTTTLFTLPEELRPTSIKDFVAFGQTNNTDGYIGYGYITSNGTLQVRFNVAITSYIRFSFTYDLD